MQLHWLEKQMYTNHVTGVFGYRGSGKSTWLARNLETFRPFILVDPLYDPKFERFNLYKIESLEEGMDLFKNGNPQRVYISPNLEAFDFFCGLAMAKRGITLVIDEVDNYCNNYRISDQFRIALKYGRHRQVNIVVVARRPKEMNPLLRSQLTRFIIFPMGGEDIQEFRMLIGEHANKILELRKTENISSDYLDIDYNHQTCTIKKINYLS
jgi:hypothetical protein